MPFVDIDDFLSDTHYGVHVVGIDERGHVVFTSDVLYQLVDNERGFRVQTGVRFVAEQILRIQGNSTCNGHTLLHTATDFTGKFIFRFDKVHAFQTKHGTTCTVAQRIRTEHIKRKHYIIQHRHRVEQGGALEYHPHFPTQGLFLFLSHCEEIAVVV